MHIIRVYRKSGGEVGRFVGPYAEEELVKAGYQNDPSVLILR